MRPSDLVAELRRQQEIIDDPEAQIRAKKAEMEAELEEIKSKYEPASLYVPMSVPDFNKACWARDEAHCAGEGISPAGLSAGALVDAMKKNGDAVKTKLKLEFLAEGNNRGKLVDWMRMTIGQFDSAGDVRAARRYRTLLACAGVEVPECSF